MSLTAQDLTLAGRLADVSAALQPGEVTAICGPNGAGKSSLLACLAGLLVAECGAVSLGGQPLGAMPPRTRARAIGYLPQASAAAWDMTVEVMVALGRLPWQGAPLARAAASREQDHAAVETALAAMDLLPLRARPMSRLSGGEAARAPCPRARRGAAVAACR